MGSVDASHVDPDGFLIAYPRNFPFLHRVQQLGLRRHQHLADLVKEQRPAIGHLKHRNQPVQRASNASF